MTAHDESKVALMVWSLYARVLQDPDLSPYFVGVSVPLVVEHQYFMFRALLVAGHELPDYDIAAVHSKLKVKNSHFTKLAEYVLSVLQDFYVPQREISRTMTILGSYRAEIVKELDDI